ncbi:MAG: hypothetical protein ACXQTV_02300 [Candidatus Hecatellaceae archaeon]
MGKTSQGVKCSVEGCQNPAVRSLSAEKVASAGLKVSSSGRRVYLCKEHYKQFKKLSRRERELERVRWKP